MEEFELWGISLSKNSMDRVSMLFYWLMNHCCYEEGFYSELRHFARATDAIQRANVGVENDTGSNQTPNLDV